MVLRIFFILPALFHFLILAGTPNTPNELNIIQIEEGMIFTQISINGKEVRAMIDLGDPHMLMMSNDLATDQNIDLELSDETANYIDGSSYELYYGIANTISVGAWEMHDIEFGTSPGEIEKLNDDLGLVFDAVLGWGFFSKFYTKFDYVNKKVIVSHDPFNEPSSDITSYYNRENGYLELPIEVNGELQNFILDSGSQLSLIDKKYSESLGSDHIRTTLADEELYLTLYRADLSLLTPMGIYGIIGSDIMNRFIVSLDPFKEYITLIQTPVEEVYTPVIR